MRRYKIIALLLLGFYQVNAQPTVIKYLSGTDKDHTVDWDFFCTEGAKSGSWTKIPVPSNWEMQGFGGYNYGHEKNKHKEHGLYKYHFIADKKWNGKQIELVFEAVMTDVEVKINGQVVGPIHQGGFYQFSYNITRLLKFGEDNVLEADVSKMSADSSVNRAEREGDFWVFGGIYRPVYLKILPNTFTERVAIDAKADGKFTMDVFTENAQAGDEIVAQVKTMRGENLGNAFSAAINTDGKTTLTNAFNNPLLWSSEFPNLYKVDLSIKRSNETIHTTQQRFGFRTIEVRKEDGIYLNNVKVILKGVNRHSSWPESGRTLSRKIHLLDIGLIKDMNMNAVRMSHYPPDAEFLDLCDSLGLFVLDELTGWQKKYATPVGRKLVKELVLRDVNHPSIIFWDNGNEGGFNFDLDNDYALYDPQQRTVLHPWSNFNNVDTKHYPDYTYIEKAAAKKDVLLHTEMIHGLYDGGHGAGLEDYWKLMRSNPRHAGGFLWVLADEGIVRHDKHDSIDTYGNNAPDGIVGPHREKEGSFYTIKEIWSPVQVSMPKFTRNFSGDIEIENNYHFIDLSACSFTWRLISNQEGEWNGKTGHYELVSGKIKIGLPPGQKKIVHLPLPEISRVKGHTSAIQFTAIDPYGRELYTWTNTAAVLVANYTESEKAMLSIREKMNYQWRSVSEDANGLTITQDRISYHFDKTSGLLETITIDNKLLPFGKGPVLSNENLTLENFSHKDSAGNAYHIVEASFTGKDRLVTRWVFSALHLLKLEYAYTQSDSSDFYGIGFGADESSIKGMWWLGAGPYHVWKNRLKGVSVDTWYNAYNNTITGETFNYPEFKGYYADMRWVRIETKVSPITIHFNNPGTYLQMLHPARQKTNFNPFVNPPFPKTDIGFMDAIPPIGTKFKGAETMGPQSQKNSPTKGWISKSMWFEFR